MPGVAVELHPGTAEIVNVVARIKGHAPGRRIVFNGHLDTYPLGERMSWSVNPDGEVVGGRLYGRGAADMKGGIAASMAAMAALAEQREAWAGEVVLTLAGDEESMGPYGTKYLLDQVSHASGDAVIIGDAGSPMVLRFGEKGFLWIEIEAEGYAAHGAHVHLGINAIDRLREALDRVSKLRSLAVVMPVNVADAIRRARPVSEPLCGAGEADVLSSVTVNIGTVSGGSSPNLVPSQARAAIDLRLPVGVTSEAVLALLREVLDLPGITWRVLRCFEPNHTGPGDEIVTRCATAATDIIGRAPAINMRVGGSDARWFRMSGIPTVVYGPTPHNMGAPDEYADIAELATVSRVHALTALDMLTRENRE
ncbi:acetylornithine deacetylase/succinyl-diaminopimelate desuccinylase-like protein [Bradyrhizobium sp. USDA 4532]|uniref:M20/M25/M40 family metallo-hydrolase n=1 Tax=unclassified Bradyrhizobium TaxID=2631580 RepID=UPI00209ED7EE|nr:MULTISPECIES: M20/M25/M40 family metallo-hydrolase [unclassified Bradyrhizobium]MCP1833176.1 acetylornithine deacetylase/succinyl-diaminopimelate desuccinylase-like protein [Bradyrhizobium sp. USDA 4545]MCP1917920.1 acetylornithine deacetylase/succinyl-diaminopimelate desuccinylase-like protein [Bradyrhizobium sp. USDA 4532]